MSLQTRASGGVINLIDLLYYKVFIKKGRLAITFLFCIFAGDDSDNYSWLRNFKKQEMVRTVLIADKQTLSFQVPVNYIGKQVEVIAFTIDEPLKESRERKKRVFTTIKTNVTDFKFNRDELNER